MSKKYKNLKGKTLSFALILAFTISSFFVLANDSLDVEFLQTRPYLRAGDENVVLGVLITNKTDEKFENVRATLVLSFPFSPSVMVDRYNRSDTFFLGDLEKRASKEVLFKIDVDDNAKYGDYEIPLLISYTKENKIEEMMFKTQVHITGTTLVEIRDISIKRGTKKYVEAGDKFEIEVKVKNIGDNKLEWLKIELNLNPLELQSPPILPASSLKRIFEDVRQNREVVANFELVVGKDTEPMSYPIQVFVIYKDEVGEIFKENQMTGVEVRGKAELVLQGVEADPSVARQGEEVSINVSLKNVGDVEAESIVVTLASDFGEFFSYASDIEKNDSEAVIFVIKIPEDSEIGDHTFDVKIDYKDPYGTKKTLSQKWKLTVSEAERDNMIYLLLGALIIMGAFVFFLAKKKLS